MPLNKYRSIIDPPEPGTTSTTQTITDEKPQVHVYGGDRVTSPEREAYEEAQEANRNDPYLSGGEKDELLGEGEPEETYEERMARATD